MRAGPRWIKIRGASEEIPPRAGLSRGQSHAVYGFCGIPSDVPGYTARQCVTFYEKKTVDVMRAVYKTLQGTYLLYSFRARGDQIIVIDNPVWL